MSAGTILNNSNKYIKWLIFDLFSGPFYLPVLRLRQWSLKSTLFTFSNSTLETLIKGLKHVQV